VPEVRVVKCDSPFMAFVKHQTLLTGFPNWDVSRVWSETRGSKMGGIKCGNGAKRQ